MIQGVNILETIIETQSTADIGALIGGISGVILGVIVLLCLCFEIADIFKRKRRVGVDCLFGLVFLFISLVGGMHGIEDYFAAKDYTTIRYKVIIDDSVNFHDFIDRYDVIAHDGGAVYIIQDRK